MAETQREAILEALRDLLASDAADGFFPVAIIDEPEPTGWAPVPGLTEADPILRHACGIQDGPPPSHLASASGEEVLGDELELEAVIAYVVEGKPRAGQTTADVRGARRARRDAGVKRIAALIAADRTLGLSSETYADVRPVQRDDDVGFPNAEPGAVALVPIRVLYTAANAAD